MIHLKIAVVTGGHPYDVQPFQELFAALPDCDAYIQHTDAFASEPEAVRDSYNAVVFYSMFKDTPQDDLLWYTGKPRSAFERLGELGQGIVVLHHGLLAYPEWDTWDSITGMKKRVLQSYHPNELVPVEIADPQHPILQGSTSAPSAWRMIDETYVLGPEATPETDASNHVFLTTANPNSMKPLAWTRAYRRSRVFCFASGHGYATYNNPGFRRVLANGIRWAAGEGRETQ
jgi:uncharacterized protein